LPENGKAGSVNQRKKDGFSACWQSDWSGDPKLYAFVLDLMYDIAPMAVGISRYVEIPFKQKSKLESAIL